MYRDAHEALQLKLTSTEETLANERHRAELAEEAFREATNRLERLRDGVAECDDLDERGLGKALRTLSAVGLLGIFVSVGAAAAFCSRYFPDPLISWDGLRNAAWIVRHREGLTGLGGAAAILVLLAPWAMLPWVGAAQIRIRRRGGWLLGLVASLLWFPTPAFPLALYVFARLMHSDIRRVFLAERR